MSAQVEEFSRGSDSGREGQLALAPDPVEVRRNAGLMALVGVGAAAITIAYAARAAAGGGAIDWILTGVLAIIALVHLGAFVDSRTPLLVADAQGVRVRLGRTWRGLPWQAVQSVEHTPRRGWLRDGRLVVVPHTEERFLSELDARGRRQVAMNRRLHGAALAMPLGLTTRTSSPDEDLVPTIQTLAGAGTTVLRLDPAPVEDSVEAREESPKESAGESAVETAEERAETSPESTEALAEPRPTEDDTHLEPADEQDSVSTRRLPDLRPGVAQLIGRAAGSMRRERKQSDADQQPNADQRHDSGQPVADEPLDQTAVATETAADPEAQVEVETSPTPLPVRLARLARRSEATATVAPDDEAEQGDQHASGDRFAGRAVSRPGRVDLVEEQAPDDQPGDGTEDTQVLDLRVRPIARAGHAVAPLEIEDYVAEPADDPVVGPEVKAARTRLGLSVDQLAERTRIRPHVIESIEVDDFVPCGGDFYARGHLRTLARVLGMDAAPLLTSYDARYAHAPVSPRQVFEAELASGTHGGIRGTRGGPNWSVLVAAVMAVVLAWSIARLVMDGPEEFRQAPSLSDGSGGVGGTSQADSIPVLLRAAAGGARVVVRDGNDKVVFTGDLSYGASRSIKVVPPVRVESTDGGVEVVVDGVDQGQIGEAGQPATATFLAR